MSRIGKKPIELPSGVNVTVAGNVVTVEAGGKRLSMEHRPEVSVKVDGTPSQIVVDRADDGRIAKAMHGMTRALLNNMVEGVTKGFERSLEINGVGWNATVQGRNLSLKIGYADTRVLEIPMGVDCEAKGTKITVKGPDKQAVGQFAANIRRQRPPEPYNGKGIKYSDEVIVRKQGKVFASGGA